jgi:hypothetical protein
MWVDRLNQAKADSSEFAKVWKEGFSDSPWETLGHENAEEMCEQRLGLPIREVLGKVAEGELSEPFRDE